MKIEESLERCRVRAAAYLDAQLEIAGDARYWRHSATHDSQRDPGHLLYGTWGGVFASVVLRRDREFTPASRRQIANALNRFQRPDGTFVLPDVPEADRVGHDDEYLAMHCTNYALGALRALGEKPRYPLTFMERYQGDAFLAEWLDDRDWSRPWTEGNKVVNIASFYAVLAEDGDAKSRARLEQIADWLDMHQDTHTGFWHRDPPGDRAALWVAMAGAAHVLHIPYYLGRTVQHADRVVESCLGLGYAGIRSACVDIDIVDILTHLRRSGHRVAEIDDVLERYLVELLQVQNPDGGFCDSYVTPHRLYGNTAPADASVTWTTWFRLATIGMIASTLLPSQRGQWEFRNTLGTGSFFQPYARTGTDGAARFGRYLQPGKRLMLATTRNGRFARQRATARVRGWLRAVR